MFWLGMSGKDILEDVSESKKFPTVIFSTINKNLQCTKSRDSC